MFGYVTIARLTAEIRSQLYLLPKDIDLVVGIPRSGMVPAYLIALFTNRVVVDLETFLRDGPLAHGSTRPVEHVPERALAARHVLLVDDSVSTGASLQRAVERVRAAGYAGRITRCAGVIVPERRAAVDVAFIELPQPRLFEWNAFHHPSIENACFDLDGVLCVDPSDADNDDGPRYLSFLDQARPLFAPTQRIGHIVSARLEKYRAPTERWLATQGVRYGKLHLLDLPSSRERQRRQGAHSRHKADVYRSTEAQLFYESCPQQSREIARLSGKPVLCVTDMTLHLPGGLDVSAARANLKYRLRGPAARLKGWLKRRVREHASSLSRMR
jgi:uncharacterized HAD superfamily protein